MYYHCIDPVNSLWPDDAIWRHRSGSTLAQVMVWCLTAPSHYLNHCWSIIREVQRHLPRDRNAWVSEICLKTIHLKLLLNLQGYLQGLNLSLLSDTDIDDELWLIMLINVWLTHRGRVTHVWVSKLNHNGLDNGLLPVWHQAIIWTNPGLSLIEPLGTYLNEIWIKTPKF